MNKITIYALFIIKNNKQQYLRDVFTTKEKAIEKLEYLKERSVRQFEIIELVSEIKPINKEQRRDKMMNDFTRTGTIDINDIWPMDGK